MIKKSPKTYNLKPKPDKLENPNSNFVRRPRVAIALALRRRQAFGGRWEAQALAKVEKQNPTTCPELVEGLKTQNLIIKSFNFALQLAKL